MNLEVIFALWKRQVMKYFRSPSRLVGFIGQPLLFLLTLGFGFKPVFERALGGNYINFIVPGIIAMTVLFTAMFSGIELLWDKQFGFLKETLVAPISRADIMTGRTLGGATVAILQGVLVVVIAFLVGFRPELRWELVATIPFAFLIALIFTSIGTAAASTMNDMQSFPIIMNFLVMPLFFLSGAMFPIKGVSKTLDFFVHADPLTYGVDGLRLAFIRVTSFSWSLDFTVMILVAIGVVGIGSYLFSRMRV